MVQIMQFLHMQGDPFHFLSNVLNSEIFSIVLIPLLIEFHMLLMIALKGELNLYLIFYVEYNWNNGTRIFHVNAQ